jgi:hypothetical protein
MRKAMGETSNNLSVGMGSAPSCRSCARADSLFAWFARSAWLVCAERATEKNKST